MVVRVQGTILQWANVSVRVNARPDVMGLHSTPPMRAAAFAAMANQNLSFTSMEEFFRSFRAALALGVAAAFAVLKQDLRSQSAIMALVPTKFIRLTDIPQPTRGYVHTVITGVGVAMPSGAHKTDPRTGHRATGNVLVTEYYLNNAAGRRMTRRNQQGMLAYYYSNGPHGQSHYYYALIIDAQGRPVLRGAYPQHLQVPI